MTPGKKRRHKRWLQRKRARQGYGGACSEFDAAVGKLEATVGQGPRAVPDASKDYLTINLMPSGSVAWASLGGTPIQGRDLILLEDRLRKIRIQ